VFDVDGALVDIRRSYNTAIKRTVDLTLGYISDTKHNFRFSTLVSDDIILKFRGTGGFNDDIDTSYAICLAELAHPHTDVNNARAFLYRLAKNTDESGIISAEKYLTSISSTATIMKLKKLLAYPAPVPESLIATIFNELFYGPELFRKIYGREPRFYFGKPLIADDRLVVTKRTMDLLAKKFNGNLALVSGRGRLAAEISLEPILDKLDKKACVFLEDERREYAKPNPYGIIKAMKSMGAKTAIYAGDSFEDLLMIRRAEEKSRFKIAFCGIYGCSPRPLETMKQLEEEGADVVIENINQLPKILNKVS
jgi:phosphoglycolate phosphatase-like HAD superfamily hydrolase